MHIKRGERPTMRSARVLGFPTSDTKRTPVISKESAISIAHKLPATFLYQGPKQSKSE